MPKQKQSTKSKANASKRPWRKNKKIWTDTLFEKKLLANPSLMTSSELVQALSEYLMWWSSKGKYDWQEDPVKEGAEEQCPFSSRVLTNLFHEAIARLKISGDLAMGRFK